jgi:outer membrane immunogenic protein
MKNAFLKGASALCLIVAVSAAPAMAADVYSARNASGYKDGPAYVGVNWSGLYVGVNGGDGWSGKGNQLADAVFGFGGVSPQGGFGGGQAGYNWQANSNLILGIEADIQGAGITGTGSFADFGGTAHVKSQVDMFGTVRGRAGLAAGQALIYFTGGLAYGNVDNQVAFNPGVTYGKSGFATGYVLGGGLEYKVNPSWSLKGEYQYINLGKNDPAAPSGTAFSYFPGNVVNDDAFHTVRLGLNYHVAPAYEPLK